MRGVLNLPMKRRLVLSLVLLSVLPGRPDARIGPVAMRSDRPVFGQSVESPCPAEFQPRPNDMDGEETPKYCRIAMKIEQK